MNQCEICGAYLDAGERCDCRAENGIKLMKLTLENFQGIRSTSFIFDGKNAGIYGDNATGKTTVFNAYTWLLVDAPSTGAKGFTPKTITADGEAHGIDHSAEAEFSVNGRRVTLKKTYKEVYKKQRGGVTAEFSGHTTEYYIDDVPMKEKDYAERVNELFGDAETRKMLIMPDYFPSAMSWEARRKLLVEMCGNITDDEIFAQDTELLQMKEFMDGRTPEEYRKIAKARSSKINAELNVLPSRIDEAKRAIPDVSGLDETAIQAELDALMSHRTPTGDTDEILALGDRINAARNAHEARAQAWHDEHFAKLRKLKQNAYSTQFDIEAAQKAAGNLETEIAKAETKRKALREQWQSVNAETFDTSSCNCPTCGKPFDAEKVEELQAAFNRSKAERLEEISKQGREVSQTAIEAKKAELQQRITEVETLQRKLAELKDEIATLEAEANPYPAFDETDEAKQLRAELDAYKPKEPTQERTERMKELQQQLASIRTATTQQQRVAELETQLKDLAAEYEECERILYLCEKFIRCKMNTLSDRINGKFKTVKFRLFQEQLNGGMKDDCEVLIPSESGGYIPYAFANNAGKINAGLEIINAIIAYKGTGLPVFVDNAESVTTITAIDTQIIRLVVSAEDKVLRTEI